MENATKALLIAAAILVAILIISLGIAVYNMAAETVGSVNLSAQEIQAFNEKFNRYIGENQRGNQANGLLNTVINSNLAETDEAKKVTVVYKSSASGGEETYIAASGSAATKSSKKFDTGKTYKIETEVNEKTGLVTKVIVTAN